MRIRLPLAVALATLIPVAAAAAFDGAPSGQPDAPLPSFRHGSGGSDPDGLPGVAAPPSSDRPSAGPEASPGHGAADLSAARPQTRADRLDKLFDRLARAQDEGEARGIAGRVQQIWMESGSDTADLLMERATTAMAGDRHDVAAALLDKLVELRPGWAEAWNKRATLRFLDGDDTGAMEDISHVLAIEPRHFGALSGMGFILARHGENAGALKALRRALTVYPGDADIRKTVDKLTPTVEGQDL